MRYTPSTIAPRAIVTPLNGARCPERRKEEGNGSAVVGREQRAGGEAGATRGPRERESWEWGGRERGGEPIAARLKREKEGPLTIGR